jgi:hypothetical protein
MEDDEWSPAEEAFARECKIRDAYALRLREFRPQEWLLKTENTLAGSRVRADMRTVDSANRLRLWEFKVEVSYDGLGQIQTYVALERRAQLARRTQPGQMVRGVLAGFTIQPEIRIAVEMLNLGIELVELPGVLRLAGGVPALPPTPVPDIPLFINATSTGDSL